MDAEYDMDAAVLAGATLLDERYPDWKDEIDLDTLDMGTAETCILGQLYGEYFRGTAALDLGRFGLDPNRGDPVDYGFITPIVVMDDDDLWDELRDRWIALITESSA